MKGRKENVTRTMENNANERGGKKMRGFTSTGDLGAEGVVRLTGGNGEVS